MQYDNATNHPDDEVNFAEVLKALWADGSISLSVAAWWIATGGEPSPCGDDALDLAAKELIRAALDGRIVIFGQNKAGDTLAISSETFGKTLKGASFTGAPGDDMLFFKSPVLRWRFDIADEVFSDVEGNGDTIEDRDIVLWRRMFVRTVDLKRVWAGESSAAQADSLPPKPKRRTKSVRMSEFMRAYSDHDPGKSCAKWRDYFARNAMSDFDMADDDTILRAALMAWPPVK